MQSKIREFWQHDSLPRVHVDESHIICVVPGGSTRAAWRWASVVAASALPACHLKSAIDCFHLHPAQWSLLFDLMMTLTLADDEEIREGAEITQKLAWYLSPLLVFILLCMHVHCHLHVHMKLTDTQTTSSDCFEYQFGPWLPDYLTVKFTLEYCQWNNFSSLPLLFGWLCRQLIYSTMSPVSLDLISAIKPFYPQPPSFTRLTERWLWGF